MKDFFIEHDKQTVDMYDLPAQLAKERFLLLKVLNERIFFRNLTGDYIAVVYFGLQKSVDQDDAVSLYELCQITEYGIDLFYTRGLGETFTIMPRPIVVPKSFDELWAEMIK